MFSFTYISVALFLIRPTTENYKITHERKFWSHKKKFRGQEIPTRKDFGPTNYPKKKIWDPRNTHEKILGTHEIPTRKYFGPTTYPQRQGGAVPLDLQDPRWHATHKILHTLKPNDALSFDFDTV